MPRLAKPIEFFYNEENENYAATGNHYRSDIISNNNSNQLNLVSNSNESNLIQLNSLNNILLILFNSIIKIFSGRKLNRNEYICLGVFIILFSCSIYLILD
jgi:hypothetical protein